MSKALKKAGRQSLVSIGGSLISAVVSFALVWLATTRLGKDQAGVLLLAVALFNIAARVALMGTATGLVRSISQARATGHTGDIPRSAAMGLNTCCGARHGSRRAPYALRSTDCPLSRKRHQPRGP